MYTESDVLQSGILMKTPPTTIRLSSEDRELIDQLKKRFGLSSITQVIRLALRLAVEQKGHHGRETNLPG